MLRSLEEPVDGLLLFPFVSTPGFVIGRVDDTAFGRLILVSPRCLDGKILDVWSAPLSNHVFSDFVFLRRSHGYPLLSDCMPRLGPVS